MIIIYIYIFFFKEQSFYTAADVINKCELSSIFSKFLPILCFIKVVMLMGTQNFFFCLILVIRGKTPFPSSSSIPVAKEGSFHCDK